MIPSPAQINYKGGENKILNNFHEFFARPKLGEPCFKERKEFQGFQEYHILEGEKTLRRHSINTLSAQSTLVINMIPGCAALGPLKSLATFSYCGCILERIMRIISYCKLGYIKHKIIKIIPYNFCKQGTWKPVIGQKETTSWYQNNGANNEVNQTAQSLQLDWSLCYLKMIPGM